MGTENHSAARPIEGRLEQHDRDQFEVKLDYAIDPSKVRNRYEVDAYFFLPKSLGVDAQTYPKAQFYSDVQAYLRFKTPGLSLKELARAEGKASPLGRVMVLLESRRSGTEQPQDGVRLSQELQLVGCLMRTNLRHRGREIRRGLHHLMQRDAADSRELDGLRFEIQGLVQEARCVLAKYRLLRSSFSQPELEASLVETYALVDEYMSLTFEGHLTRLLKALEDASTRDWPVQGEQELLSKSIVDERAHRRGCGHESQLADEGSNETLVYRLGLLKKFVMSVLFLEIARDRDGHGAANFVAALAAGVAMLVATLAAIFVQTMYAVNTLPFVLALTIGYMAKDRVKEWAKLYLSAKMAPWLSDYKVKILNPVDGTVVGSCLERVSICGTQDLPAEVLGVRHGPRLHSIEAQSKREIVLHYRKRISIYGRKFSGLDGQVHEINDIIRFSVSRFSSRMDDPIRSLLAFDERLQRVREISCSKVYHLNLVFVLRALDSSASPRIEHARVILDKGGIRRLESNDSALPGSSFSALEVRPAHAEEANPASAVIAREASGGSATARPG